MANCKNKQAASRTLGKEDTVSPRMCQIKQSGKNKINNFLRPNEKRQMFLIQASSGSPLSDGPLDLVLPKLLLLAQPPGPGPRLASTARAPSERLHTCQGAQCPFPPSYIRHFFSPSSARLFGLFCRTPILDVAEVHLGLPLSLDQKQASSESLVNSLFKYIFICRRF